MLQTVLAGLFSIAALATAPTSHAGVWTPVGPFHARPVALAFVPGLPDTLLVSAAGSTVRSADSGNTFAVVAGQSGFAAFATGGPGSNVIYASTSPGISKSLDGGLSWQVVNRTWGFDAAAAVAPGNANVIYSGGPSAAFRSADGGASFTRLPGSVGALLVTALVVSPTDENVVYAGTIGPLYKSTNGGQTFAAISPAGVFRVRALAMDPVDARTLYVVLRDGVYKTSDAGASFSKLALAVPPPPSSIESDASIAIDGSDSRSLYVAVAGQLWHSSDAGASWSAPVAVPANAVVVRLQPDGKSLFALADELYRSRDGGATWSVVALGLSDERIPAIVSNPLAPDRIYIAGSTGEFISVERGQNFQRIASLPKLADQNSSPQLLAIDPTRPQIAYFTVAGGMQGLPKLFRTANGGGTWDTFYAPAARPGRFAESFDAFAASPVAGTLNVVSASYGGPVIRASYLHRSIDDGISWTVTPITTSGGISVQAARVLLVDSHAPPTLYLGAAGFHRSTDAGATWTSGGAPFDGADLGTSHVIALAQLPTTPTTLLASPGVGVYRSTDGGATWTVSSAGLRAAPISQIAVDAERPNIVYAATLGAGVYRSVDGGLTWTAFNAGLDMTTVLNVHASGDVVIAGTPAGAWRCADRSCGGGAAQKQAIVVEFYNTSLNHYFMTADTLEATAIDAGSAGPGWVRTNATFNGWKNAADAPYDAAQIYRFYGTPNVGPNSHFYTLSSAEYAKVLTDRGWFYEHGNWFWTMAPTASGQCPANTTPVYRAYNNRFAFNDSNHRYTTSQGVLQSMVSQGWIAEGVVMCSPR